MQIMLKSLLLKIRNTCIQNESNMKEKIELFQSFAYAIMKIVMYKLNDLNA